MNMIYKCNETRREKKLVLREVYASEPAIPRFMAWSEQPVSCYQSDHPTSVRQGGKAALVLNPIIEGCHLNKVLNGGNSLNLIYVDTLKKMGVDGSRIQPTHMRFKGITWRPNPWVRSHRTWCLVHRKTTISSHLASR